MPPSAAPTASMVPHSEPDSALAVARSSSSTRFGNAAAEAGSNPALNVAMPASRMYATQTVESLWTNRNPTQRAARARSATTMSLRRSRRSASTPAAGEQRK